MSKKFGSYEYLKDTNDILIKIDEVNKQAKLENWNLKELVLFTIDVKALYPSVKFKY